MKSRAQRAFWLGTYYCLCWLVPNLFVAALKTAIAEALDYPKQVWFARLLTPLHFYILSVVFAHLWMIGRSCSGALRLLLCAYVQLGLLGGYVSGIYRLMTEPFDLLDLTTGANALFLLACVGILNWDVARRALDFSGASTSGERHHQPARWQVSAVAFD